MTIRLHNISPRPGAKHRKKRLGHGESSGHGKTSGRGGKGQSARSGSSIRATFEGGQMPLFRRLPKRGFNNARFAATYIPVNVGDLNRFQDGDQVDEKVLRGVGLANGSSSAGIKILGDGKLSKKITVIANSFSASARAIIESLGGACTIVSPVSRVQRAKSKRSEREETSALRS